MRRFPLRTLLLMALALVAFVRLYFLTHPPQRQAAPPEALPTRQAPDTVAAAGAQACRTLDRTLEEVVRAPEDLNAFTRARAQFDACAELPSRACELGAALDARTPPDSGMLPSRQVLGLLCERCPPRTNPCAVYVARTVLAQVAGATVDAPRLRWNLEHAGKATPEACTQVVRLLLAPAALSSDPLPPARRETLGQLAPPCAREGLLPASVLNAAVVQGDVPALAALVRDTPTGEGDVLRPDRLVGPPGGEKAFDAQASTGVELSMAENSRWRKDGALSAVFEPPVHRLTALRVRARGPGALRAAVRVEASLGLSDPDTKTSFVLPVACRFQGTGQWETCTLPVPLLDVEALSAFPEKPSLSLMDVDVRGTR